MISLVSPWEYSTPQSRHYHAGIAVMYNDEGRSLTLISLLRFIFASLLLKMTIDKIAFCEFYLQKAHL